MILLGGRNNGAPFPAGCGSFNGTDSRVALTKTGLFGIADEWTICLWATRPEGLTYYLSYVDFTFHISSLENGNIYVRSGEAAIANPSLVDVGDWQFLVVRQFNDSGTYRFQIYENNVFIAQRATGPTAPTDGNFQIGCQGNISTFYDGKIAGVFYYSRAMTDTELSNIYTYGASKLPATGMVVGFPLCEQTGSVAYDVSGNGNHGTWNGTSPYYTTQEQVLYPRQKGYSKYTKSGADDLYVPYEIDGDVLTITPPTGYTKAFDAPA